MIFSVGFSKQKEGARGSQSLLGSYLYILQTRWSVENAPPTWHWVAFTRRRGKKNSCWLREKCWAACRAFTDGLVIGFLDCM